MNNQMSVSGFLNFGIENAKRHCIKFIGLYIIAVVVLGIGVGIASLLSNILGRSVGGFIGGLLEVFISITVVFGFLKNVLNLCRGEKIDFIAFIKTNPIIILNFFILYILIAIAVTIGTILLIVPGVILSVMLSPALLMVIDRKMGPIEAIKESVKITAGHKMDIFAGTYIGVLVAVLLILPVVTLIFSVPMMLFVSIYPYLQLTGQLDEVKKNLESLPG